MNYYSLIVNVLIAQKYQYLTLSLLILLSLINLKAEEKTLLYNFKVGDEFDVVFTKSDRTSRFSNRCFFSFGFDNANIEHHIHFKVLSKGDSSTHMEAIFTRIKRTNTNYIFDTDLGFSPLNDTDILWHKVKGEKLTFKINEHGQVGKIKSNLPSPKTDTYISHKRMTTHLKFGYLYINNRMPGIRTIIQACFPITYSIQDFNHNHTEEYTKHTYHRGGQLLANDNSRKTIYKVYKPFIERSNDSIELKRVVKYVVDIDQPTDTIIFNYDKGRIQSGKLGYFSQFSMKNITIEYNSDKVKNKSPQKTIHFSGEIQNANKSKMSLYLWKKYPDSELLTFNTIPIGKNGKINWTADLHRPYELCLKIVYNDTQSSDQKHIFIEPGDSIQLNIDANTPSSAWKIISRQSAKFTIADKMKIELQKISETISFRSFADLNQQIVSHQKRLINEVSEQELSYSSKRNLIANIYAGLYRVALKICTKQDITEKNWKDQLYKLIDIDKNSCYTSLEMRQLIYSWYISKYGHRASEDQFVQAKLNTNGENRYFLLSYLLNETIRKGKILEAGILYDRFARLYPESELTSYFNAYLGDVSQMQLKHKAPPFELLILGGKKYNSSLFKDQWTYFTFINSKQDIKWSQIKTLGRLYENNNDKRLQTIMILTDPVLSLELQDSIRSYYKGIILHNPNWKYKTTHPYRASYRYSGFLTNPHSQFEALWYPLRTEHIGYEKDKQIKEEVNSLNEYMDHWEKENNYGAFDWRSLAWIFTGCLLLIIMVILSILIRQKRKQRLNEQKKEKLQLELKSIRSQLNPHFIFNSMNSIQHLVADGKNKDASRYLSEFSGLMRQVLLNADKQLIPLEEEISSIKKYLELETLRFGFEYSIEVNKQLDVFNIEVPSLFLQPFVENAVIHGISGLKEKGNINVSIHKENKRLLCSIDDNGIGYKPVTSKEIGHGISLSKKRFEMIQDSLDVEIKLSIVDKSATNVNEKGTLVEISYELESE